MDPSRSCRPGAGSPLRSLSQLPSGLGAAHPYRRAASLWAAQGTHLPNFLCPVWADSLSLLFLSSRTKNVHVQCRMVVSEKNRKTLQVPQSQIFWDPLFFPSVTLFGDLLFHPPPPTPDSSHLLQRAARLFKNGTSGLVCSSHLPFVVFLLVTRPSTQVPSRGGVEASQNVQARPLWE